MIGFIDSGVGGINLIAECAKLFKEDFIFLCDNKNAPYGNKSKRKLLKITKNNIEYLISHFNIELCVIACNTLSYTIGEEIKKQFNIPIILTKYENLENCKNNDLFFATKNTIKNSEIINNKIKQNSIKTLYINGFARKIDENINDLEKLNKILKKHLLNKKYNNVKTIILGCTHFKSIKNNIKSILKNIEIIEYEQDIAKKIQAQVTNKETSSFYIVLTDYYYSKLVQLKFYLFKQLESN